MKDNDSPWWQCPHCGYNFKPLTCKPFCTKGCVGKVEPNPRWCPKCKKLIDPEKEE